MDFIFWIIFGALIGWIAGKVTKQGRDMSLFQSIIVGIVGSAVGGFIGQALNLGTVSGFNLGSIILAVLGAVIVLWVVNKMGRRR